MDAFSYLSVLFSIILGLAITQLLQGLGRLLQERRRVRMYWPVIAWVAILLAVAVQTWWAMFGLRNYQTWSFGGFAVVLFHITLIFLLTALVLPDFSAPGEIDLRANYFGHARWFFGIAAIVTVASLLKDVVLNGALPNRTNTGFHAIFFAVSAAAASVLRDGFHKFIAVGMSVLFAAYILTLFTRLQ